MGAIDSGRWLRASSHLDRVLDLPRQEWTACLNAIRAEDPDIATDVEAMLDEHRRLSAEGFLDAAPQIEPLEASLAGVTIGAYTLKSSIGHGGMGSVWLASRSDGRFEGQVAVKLLNAALVGRGGEERFRREGTILARLAHPHIARLIDAGVSNTGQPYLVLELVEGRHIDAYCNEARLSVEARIRLFLERAVGRGPRACQPDRASRPQAVERPRDRRRTGQAARLQHRQADRRRRRVAAHPGGRVGADAEVRRAGASDRRPHHDRDRRLCARRVAVRIAERAPSRRRLRRSRRPNTPGRSPRTSRCACRRRCTARAPPTPSCRIAAERATTPDRLRRQLRGDLETILSKALKKDPAERYASVAEFADDLRRHVEHQPISARPDALGYRTAKFVRRHWRGVTATAVTAAVLATLVGFYTVQLAAERDRARLEAAKASQVSELMTGVLLSADPYRTPGNARTNRAQSSG